MTTLKVGIASYEEMKARTMAVARGERQTSGDMPCIRYTARSAGHPESASLGSHANGSREGARLGPQNPSSRHNAPRSPLGLNCNASKPPAASIAAKTFSAVRWSKRE